MKKFTLGLLFVFLTYLSANAQEFEANTNIINVGIGFAGDYGFYSSANASPVFSASYDRGVWDVPGPGVVGLGGYIGHRTFKYSSTSEYKWSQTVVGVRGTYHYNGFNIDKLDIYAGFLVGYYFYSNKNTDSAFRTYSNSLDHSGFIGGRWFFTEHIAGYVEAGYGISNISLGAAFKF
ncbi:hypothetical protein [Seonamhaeicola marinus]|uniref:Porin family protein n=1 Tax=Seonamhaeicola marinus TaxID=1912246 RepID=A0A5D0HWC4_9FLAO|nr:hypothetical protein [Seonamhaeicola marinus]TYA74427.1 hypothetical protein FUA24_13970 [Seonamhaeicola marinus]